VANFHIVWLRSIPTDCVPPPPERIGHLGVAVAGPGDRSPPLQRDIERAWRQGLDDHSSGSCDRNGGQVAWVRGVGRTDQPQPRAIDRIRQIGPWTGPVADWQRRVGTLDHWAPRPSRAPALQLAHKDLFGSVIEAVDLVPAGASDDATVGLSVDRRQ
jgi:hypothetical protein